MNVDNFRGKNLELSKCQSPLSHGDNRFTGFKSPTISHITPMLSTENPLSTSVKTNFIPLTVARTPLFLLYIKPREKRLL
jgi:hypothetical protein